MFCLLTKHVWPKVGNHWEIRSRVASMVWHVCMCVYVSKTFGGRTLKKILRDVLASFTPRLTAAVFVGGVVEIRGGDDKRKIYAYLYCFIIQHDGGRNSTVSAIEQYLFVHETTCGGAKRDSGAHVLSIFNPSTVYRAGQSAKIWKRSYRWYDEVPNLWGTCLDLGPELWVINNGILHTEINLTGRVIQIKNYLHFTYLFLDKYWVIYPTRI